MSSVDEILATGQYTDRRGREWFVVGQDSDLGPAWIYNEEPFGAQALIGTHHMRLLIERDMHRGECVGIHWCLTHPVVSVDYDGVLGLWKVWGPGDWFRGTFGTHAEAMDAARALAVNP